MSRWISKIIEDKQRRQAAGAQKHGHLHAFEGSKMVEGVIVGEPLFSRIRRAFHPKSGRPRLHVVKSEKNT